ncbi:hypothetical protein TELCIR_14831, partial [Teladorsagia circumcincta]
RSCSFRPHITAPPTTIRTIPFVQTTPAPRQPISLVQQNRQPTPAAPPRVVPTAPPRTVQQNQFRQPAPAVPPRVAPPLPPRISSHPVIHGVLVRQPKAIALGVSQMSFNSPIESKTHEIAVGVSPTLYEDGGDSSTFQETRRSSGSGNKLFGMPTYQRSSSDDVNSQSSLVATQ